MIIIPISADAARFKGALRTGLLQVGFNAVTDETLILSDEHVRRFDEAYSDYESFMRKVTNGEPDAENDLAARWLSLTLNWRLFQAFGVPMAKREGTVVVGFAGLLQAAALCTSASSILDHILESLKNDNRVRVAMTRSPEGSIAEHGCTLIRNMLPDQIITFEGGNGDYDMAPLDRLVRGEI